MQIGNTKNHFTFIRIAITLDIGEDVNKLELLHIARGNTNITMTLEKWQFLVMLPLSNYISRLRGESPFLVTHSLILFNND
jgi:hypothetical protein